jgi:hypothetical protein
MDGWWYIYGNGIAKQSGVNHGNGTKDIELVSSRKTEDGTRYFTLKIPGGKHWFANHEPWVSHPGAYVTLRVIKTKADGWLKCELVADYDLRPKLMARWKED